MKILQLGKCLKYLVTTCPHCETIFSFNVGEVKVHTEGMKDIDYYKMICPNLNCKRNLDISEDNCRPALEGEY